MNIIGQRIKQFILFYSLKIILNISYFEFVLLQLFIHFDKLAIWFITLYVGFQLDV